MDAITQLIKTEIKKQYRSVRQFSEKSGIPYSTLSNALSKGMGGTSYDTVVKICEMLKLNCVYDENAAMFNAKFGDICNMFAELDEYSAYAVRTLLRVEYERCVKNKKQGRNHNASANDRQSLDIPDELEEGAV